ncbi:MAG: nucleotide-binding protein [Terracoccus sp.]
MFVVHGRNWKARDAMFAFLRAVDLKPMEWNRAVSLSGSASPYIGQVLDAGFAHCRAVVVLITPDEITYLDEQWAADIDDPDTQAGPQARANVLFEAGMALGLHPQRTVLATLGRVRLFSDIDGRHLVRLSNEMSSRQALAARLRDAGCPVDTGGADWHQAGDFTPIEPGGGLPLGKRVISSSTPPTPIRFDIRHVAASGNRLDKLQIINRGTDTAHRVTVSVPEDASLGLEHANLPIERIPGRGKYVTIDVYNYSKTMGGPATRDAFDVTVTGSTEDGVSYSTDVFIDVNS